MAKRAIVFDLDDTLAASKSAITGQMAGLLDQLLQKFSVAVISGGKFEQFERQLIGNLPYRARASAALHIMPTCGTRYYRYSAVTRSWQLQYAEDIAEPEKQIIVQMLEAGAKSLGLWETETWGEIIEDRGSQITLSALGQAAPVDAKQRWDPDSRKKNALRDWVAEKIPQFEVRVGGTTSIDVTRMGIDKAYGMRKLIEELRLPADDFLFIGDKLDEGGNDYPVKAMGIDTVAVNGYRETPAVIDTIIKIS